jgi:hypothetical protein
MARGRGRQHITRGKTEDDVARRTQVVLIDDIDGQELDGNARSLTFSFAGVDYSIDLSEKNKRKFEKALEPYIAAAQRIGGGRGRKSASATGLDLKAVRAWAASNGIQVSGRGRVPASVIEQFKAAGN